jgi:hypothetical protein
MANGIRFLFLSVVRKRIAVRTEHNAEAAVQLDAIAENVSFLFFLCHKNR